MASIIPAHAQVGNPDAADDDFFLKDNFVHISAYNILKDFERNESIVLGRTGSGKTAILRNIEYEFENVIVLDPKRISFDYVSNSDAIQYADSLGVDLHIFFELLWKHVICVSLIKKILNVTDDGRQISLLDRLQASLGLDHGKLECLKYLQNWGGQFWQDIDVQVKEISEKLNQQMKTDASIGASKTFGQIGKIDNLELTRPFHI